MKKKTKRMLFIGTGLAAGAAIFSAGKHAITKHLVSVALDREEPKSVKNMDKTKEQLGGASTEVTDFMALAAKKAERLLNSDCETVEIICHSGETLVGHWYTCEGAQRTIVAMHGWRSSWANDFGMIADFWHKNHCNVLYAEQRGQNNSGGDYMGFGLLERYDCLDWVNWVNERCGTETPVYLAGVSMGATTVLMSTGLELPTNVRGIMADCGFTSPHEIWKHVVENNLHVSYGLCAAAADDMCKKKIQMGTKEYSTIEAMQHCSIPVLFVHGTDDTFVPIKMTYENYVACAGPKRLFVVPGAEHGMSYYVDRDGYEAATKNFWKDYDR